MENIFKPNDPYLKWPVEREEVNKKAEGVAFFIKLIGDVKTENNELKKQVAAMSSEVFKLRQDMDSRVSYDNL